MKVLADLSGKGAIESETHDPVSIEYRLVVIGPSGGAGL